MRSRKQIEQSEENSRCVKIPDDTWSGFHEEISPVTTNTLILEVLLDIRDLLLENKELK